jgi:hypothetical protein
MSVEGMRTSEGADLRVIDKVIETYRAVRTSARFRCVSAQEKSYHNGSDGKEGFNCCSLRSVDHSQKLCGRMVLSISSKRRFMRSSLMTAKSSPPPIILGKTKALLYKLTLLYYLSATRTHVTISIRMTTTQTEGTTMATTIVPPLGEPTVSASPAI